jgi:hypothetical protein
MTWNIGYRQNIGPSISVIGISVNFHIGVSLQAVEPDLVAKL